MPKRTLTTIIILLGAGILAAVLFTRNTRASHPVADPPALPATSVMRVTRGTVSSVLRVAGQFIPYQEVDLHAKVSGYIRRINVDIGDRVHTGQVIATLEVPELDAQLAGAQAEVRHSQSEIARSQSEIERAQSNYVAIHSAYTRLEQAAKQRPGLIAQQELDDAQAKDQTAKAQIDVAKAAFDATKEQLGVSKADSLRVKTMSDYSVVVAPFNGVITMRYADTGALIQAGTASNTQAMPVVRIAQSDLLRLRMPVPEADVRYIEPGANVKVSVHAMSREFDAKIVRYTRSMDMATRTMLAEVDVPNRDLSLNPGMYADTTIVLQRRDNVLSIPSQALVQGAEHPYVLTVNADHRVERREVQLGIEAHNRVEITKGLSEDDLVIVSGQTSYQAGEAVRPQLLASDPEEQKEAEQ